MGRRHVTRPTQRLPRGCLGQPESALVRRVDPPLILCCYSEPNQRSERKIRRAGYAGGLSGALRLFMLVALAAGMPMVAGAQATQPQSEGVGARVAANPDDAAADGSEAETSDSAAPQQAAQAQATPPQAGQAPSREAAIEQEQAAKVASVKPYQPAPGERWAQKAQDVLVNGGLKWHPFFENAYAGGGFTLGAGFKQPVSAFTRVDARGSWTFLGYKRAEVEFTAARLFHRR